MPAIPDMDAASTPVPVHSWPGSFFLRPDLPALSAYLASRQWLTTGETLHRVSRAGEGNMNCVLRVFTSQRTFILKQSRPWVEKYPQVAAPWDRALVEAGFYKEVEAATPVASFLPRLLAFDSDERLLLMEDVGEAQDFTFLYAPGAPAPAREDLARLIDFLVALHTTFRDPALARAFANRDMRRLNHEHIFALPLRPENGLPLDSFTPGLERASLPLRHHREYTEAVHALGDLYLNEPGGPSLLHGDFFPGSWLRAGQRVCVIDPEFCFFGPPEWDLGVMAAHLYFARQPRVLVEALFTRYAAAAPLDPALACRFAGVEIMRRLLGVAQLPLCRDLAGKTELLRLSRALVLEGRPA